MSSPGPRSPHLVVRQHQEAITVVAALLFGALLGGNAASNAMNATSVVHAGRISVAVAIEVGHKSALIRESLVESARTNRNLVGEVSEEAICTQPVIAERSRPIVAMSSFPLWTEIPGQWNGLRP